MYTHLNRDQRVSLATLLRAGYTQKDAAKAIGVHPSTLCRELRRNSDGGYHATHASACSRRRREQSKVAYRTIENNPILAQEIESLLHPLVSPEVVAHGVGIHHATIYAWIARSRSDLKVRLPYRGKKRKRYGKKREKYRGWTKYVRPIDNRPDAVISWEGDTVKGRTRSRLLTHVERHSLYTRVDLIPDGTADSVHALLKRYPLPGIITYDRGSEFALWRMIERDSNATIFFAHAHHPWERGKNENTNGRLRRVFPKRFDFSTLKRQDVQRVMWQMNHTPRKSLAWRTPAEVFKEISCTSG